MDLHRLRVVGFDTTVREKEGEKNDIAEHENRIKEEEKTSTLGNKDGNQCLNGNGDQSVPSKKCLEDEISPPGTSKKYLDETSTPAGAIKECVNDERTPPRTSKQCSNGKLHPPWKSKKYQNETTSTSQLGTPKTQRSKSEISIHILSKKNPRSRALKINSSDTGLTKLFQNSAHSHRKKRTLNLRNKSIHARIRHKAENEKEKKEEVHFLFAREKPSFIRDHKKRTNSERMKKKRVSKFPNDMYGFKISNRSLNQFQCQMSHLNFIDTDKLPFKKFRVGFHRKTKPPQPVTNCFCKYHAMRVLNSACGRRESRHIYYNLGTHPYPRRYQQKYRRDQEEGLRRDRSHYNNMAKDEIVEVTPSSFSPVPKRFHDACTGPSNVEISAGTHHRPHSLLEKSSTVQNVTIASEYDQKPCPLPSAPNPSAACAVPTDRQPCELNKSQTFPDVTNMCNQNLRTPSDSPSPCTLCAARAAPAQNKCKKKRKKKKKPFFIVTICNHILSTFEKVITDFHLRNNMSRKSCIKYIIVGMLIVVWSPCLLAVILAWVVMFPWKLTNVLKTNVTTRRSFATNNSFKRFRKTNLRREYQQMCFDGCTGIPEKRSFMTSSTSWYSRTVGVVVNSFKAVMSLLKFNKKKAPTRAGTLFLPSSHPNPRKRYKLFYADNRGWVMKPLRRRTRSCTSNRVVQSMRCEFRPKFWQKLRCQNLQQASFRKVPCQVHGIDSYPMHQYSPAGDAYPAQSGTPWPTCICREKYSQRPSTFTTPNSHHHLQQEVNIPVTFYHTTSGVSPISAGETVIPKLTNAKIKNSVAHTNLAKDHHGHNKNGTLPLGVVPDGLTEHDAGNTLTKAPGVNRITTLAEVSDHIPCCVHRLRRQTSKREIPLNCLSARSHKLAIGNKSSPTRVNKISFSNKCVLTDTFASTKQSNTRTHKANYAHKTQNISNPKHHKVTSKLKMPKTVADMASKCACEVKFYPPKQEYTYKTDKIRTPAQKHPSPVKIKSSTKQSIVNYSFGNKRKQSRQGYKYKPGLVSTHMLSNTAEIMTTTNRNVALNNLCGKEHEKFQYGSKHKPHHISAATQKQLCTTDITTSTNRNVALNYSRVEDHGLFEYGDKHNLHQIPVATQMQSRTADNATSTKHNVAMNFPCEEEHNLNLSKCGNQPKPHQIPVATQMQLKTTDIATCTNCNVATNCPYEEKHKLSEQGYKHKPHQILVASQMQSRIAENATDMNRYLALVRPSEEKYKLSRHSFKYKLPVLTQMQQKTVDNATGTNRDLALNYSGGVKMSTDNKEKPSIANNTDKETKYIQEVNLSDSDRQYLPGQIPVATQMQSNSADITTMTNCDLTMNYPYEGKRAQTEQAYKYESDHTFVGTQKQPSTADIITSAKYIGSVTQSTSDRRIPQSLSRASEKSSICTQKSNPSEHLSKTDVSILKHSYKIDASTDYVSDYERSKTKDIFFLEQTMSPNKTVDVIGATTSREKQTLKTKDLGGGRSRKLNGSCMYKDTQTIAYSALKGEIDNERPMRTLSKEMDECAIRQLQTEELMKQFEPHAKSPLFEETSDSRYGVAHQITQTSKDSYLPNSQQFIIATDYVCGVTHIQSKPNYKMEQITAYNTNTHKTSSAREPPNKQSQLQEAPSHTVGAKEEPKLFSIASDCTCGINHPNVVKKISDKNNSIEQSNVPKESRQYASQKTPVANTQGLKPESVSAQPSLKPSKTRTATESSPTATDIQELPCDCKCLCNSVPRLKSKIPHHIPSAQPGISKKDKTSSKSKSPKSPLHLPTKSPQKSSPQEFKQMKDHSSHALTHKNDSANQPPSKQLNLTQPPGPSHTAQEQSKFVLASDCKCGTNQTSLAEKNVYNNNNVTDTKSTTARERKSNSPARNSKHVLTHKTDSAKEPPSKQINLIQSPSRTVQEQPKFVKASDCKCGNETTAAEKNLYNKVTDTKTTTAKERKSNSPPRSSKHVLTHKTDSVKEHLSKQANLIPPPAPSRTAEEQSKLTIASDCKCGANQTTAVGKSFYNNITDTKSTTARERESNSPPRNSKHVLTHKTDSAKEPSSKQTNLIQSPSRTVQEQSKFVIASDCKCGTNETTAAEKNLYNNVTDTKSTTARERESNSPPRNSKHVLTHKNYFAKEPPSKQTNFIQSPSRTVQEQSKFVIAADCKCGTNQTTAVGKSLYNNVTETKSTTAKERKSNSPARISKNVLTHKTDSAKEPSSKHTNLIQSPSRTVQEQSKFVIASDCKCGTNQTTAVGKSLYNNITDTKSTTAKERKSNSPARISKNDLTHKTDSAKEPPSKQTNLILPPSRTAQERSKFVIASGCKCGTNQTIAGENNLYNNVTDTKSTTSRERRSNSPPRNSKRVTTHKTDSAKKPPSKQPNLIQPPPPSRTTREQSELVIAADCKCGTNQTKFTTAKKRKSNSPPSLKSSVSKFPKSLAHSSLRKLLPHKCRCQDSVGEQSNGSKDSATSTERNIVKAKTSIRSRPPKTSRKCRCSIESLLDSEGKPPYGTKFSKPTSKKGAMRVVRTLKLSGHMPPHEYLQQKCPCAVVGLQDPVPQQSLRIKVSRMLSKGNTVKVDKNRPKFVKSSKHAPPPEYWHLDCTCPVQNSQDPTGKRISQSSRKSIFRRNSKSKSFDIHDDCPYSVPQNDLHKISYKSDVPVNWNTTKRSFIRPRGSHCSVNESSSRVQSSLSQYSTKVSSLVMSISSKLFSRKNTTSKVHENTTKKTLPVNFSSFQVKSKKADRQVHDDESNQSLFRRSHTSKTQSNINQHSKTSEHSSIVTLFTRMSNKKGKKSAKKFDPQYSSTLINCQPTPTVRQTVRQQLPPSQRLLKSKNSSILMRSQSKKPFLEKIRPLAYKISTNSLKDQQEKRSPNPSSKCTCFPENLHRQPIVSEQSFQPRTTQPNIPKMESSNRSYPPKLLTVKKESEVSPRQLNAEQVIPIISGSCKCEEELKITKEHSSNHKKFEVIPQPPTPKEVIPIISGSCRCEEELKITKEHILSNHQQFEMIPQPSKPKEVIPIISGRCTCAEQQNNTIGKLHTNLPALGNEKQPESSQHLANQTLKSPAFKLSQLHASHQTDTPHNVPLRNFRSAHKKSCKCRSFEHGKEQELSKSLHKVVKNKRSQEKLQNSHLISHVCNCSAATKRLKEHIVHPSEIFQSPQIQIYQQNLPDQKGLSKIPSNVDKPPPELLQQHPSGLGRQNTAERAVQQPYPDFDRVSMRYPGYKSPPKQSVQIPGINGLPPAKNYPPAPGATPPSHYGFDPCYVGPPKICVPMVPYDETALRRAYTRRPLRYTPPRQQLPRVVMTKKLKENKHRAAEVKRRKGIQRATNFFKCLRGLVSKTEREVFPDEVVCNPMWVNALTRKPCFCIYKLCPRAYPGFLSCYNSIRYVCQLLVYFITLCFWSPLLLCGYLCCNVCCKFC